MFTAAARSIGGTLRHEVDVNGRHTIVTDEPERLGGTDTGPAPHELMAAMLAACASTMIVLYARQRDWHLSDVQVEVRYDADVTPREVYMTVHLPDGLTDGQIERLRRVARTCPARRALEAGFAFDEQITLDVRDRALSGRCSTAGRAAAAPTSRAGRSASRA
ncbi:MAG TPA: OsmC family protein [Solirubrobacteraceae bacterium]|nr:OsmC family protein [Solirubrobacteraceae bacterium]